ncbi:MAG: PEP-CTERM sorting domain-containing protein [Planctomycetota bacterium]|nr:MAG: PEP-CTERM sorting domain-containing protein [Planctomycetota bacterium]REJ91215.1 MAG: PEP-CTERM sorting domain-containing protein [Planctomycetota bacterium]
MHQGAPMIRSALKTAGAAALMTVVMFAAADSSQAAFKLFIDDLGDAAPGITITDEDLVGPPPDGAPFVPGLVSYDSAVSGPVGSFVVVVSTAISKPLIGPPDSIDFINLAVSGGTGTLFVSTTDTDYASLTGGAADFAGSISGTTTGMVSATALADDGNGEFTGATIGTLGPFVTPSFSDAFATTESPYASPFSMTLEATIVHDDPGDTTSFDFLLAVEPGAGENPIPEPSTWVLGSMALLGLGLAVRRRLLS